MRPDLGRQTRILGVLCALGAFATRLHAADNVFDLGLFDTGQQLALPLDIAEVSGEVAIEIDGIDMTEFAVVAEQQIVLELLAPLAGEFHELTVYLLQDGEFTAIAHYSFSTPATDRLTTSIDAVHEVSVAGLDGLDRLSGSSTGTLGTENEDGTFRAQLNYLASSRLDDQINENPVDLGEYSLEYHRNWQDARLTTRLGHHGLNYDRALIGGISRRGVSFDLDLYEDQVELGVFATHGDDILGLRNFTGLSDPNNRMRGARLGFRPFAKHDLRFSLQAYSGTGAPFGGELAGSGAGTSFAVEGASASGRLRYGSVWSRADWDEDAGGALPETGGAALLSYASFDLIAADDSARALTVGLTHERVDLNYFSLANPGIATGAETWQLTLDYSAERFVLSMFADTQNTNEGGPTDWPVDRISQVSVDGSYVPDGRGFWQGTTLRFGGGFVQQDRVKTPDNLFLPEDYASTTVYLGFDKLGDRGAWSLDYSHIREDDRTATNVDSTSHTLSAAFDRSINESLTLNGNLSFTRTDGTEARWDRVDANLGFGYSFTPHDLMLRMDAGMTQTNEPFAQDGEFVSAELGWQFHPSAELAMSASWADGAYASSTVQGHETVLTLTLRAATHFLR